MSALPRIATAKADIRKRSCLLYPRKRSRLNNAEWRIFEWSSEVVVSSFSRGMTQHHYCVSRCGHEIVTLFDHLSVPAVIQTEFLPPIFGVFESFKSPRLHSREHVH